jgi:hypothetical protein
MKKIGRGWQYTTYDLGNGRVLKKYNSKLIGYLFICKEIFPFRTDAPWEIPGFYRGCKETALDSIKKLQNPALEPWMMGNPRFLNTLDYEQDKLIPIHDYFKLSTTEESKRIIDAFIAFNKIMIEKRLIDKSFNISKNFALDTHGRVVLMDLGELYSSEAAIQKQIKNRAWAAHYVVNPLPEALRHYFVQKMDAVIGLSHVRS